MGKHLDQVDQKREFLLKSQKEYERAQRQLRRECSHQKVKGDTVKLTIEQVDGQGLFRCERCGDEFSMDQIAYDQLKVAQDIMHNAIQQIRCFSDVRKKEDREISQDLGQVDSSLQSVARLYERTTNIYKKNKGKNKKKKKKQGKGFGGYTSLNNSIGGR